MTDNRQRKRAIRERMERTGEPYTLAARRHDAERAGMDPKVDERLMLLDDVTGTMSWVPPDANCLTMPDGECVSEGPCMHSPRDETPSE